MALRTDQIIHEVGALLDRQIRMTMSGAGVSCLTNAQWCEYNTREGQIAELLKELDTLNSRPIDGKRPARETQNGASRYQQAS
jgi:hypothetical protein